VIKIFFIIITWFDWQALKSEHFVIFYKPGYRFEAQQVVQNLEFYNQYIIELTGNKPEHLPVVIEDCGQLSNGFANPLFYNIHIFTNRPGFGSSLAPAGSWLRDVSVHEYTHICHLTKTKGIPSLLTRVCGRHFQPNLFSPGWIIEGITVFNESQVSPYEGRLNDGFYGSYIKVRMCENRPPTIIEATNQPLQFPLEGIYLYGGEFFKFLSERYGAQSFRKFFDHYGGSIWSFLSPFFPCLGLDPAAKKVYGKSFPELFKEWQGFEMGQLSRPRIKARQITRDGWFKSQLIYYNHHLYFLRRKFIKLAPFHSKVLNQIVSLSLQDNREKVLITLPNLNMDNLKIFKGDIYYTTPKIKRGMANTWMNGFGITKELYRRNLNENTTIFLFTDDIRAFCILADSSIIYCKDRPHQYGSEIWRYYNGEKKKLGETDYLIYELVADKGRIIVSASQPYENPDIYRMDQKNLWLTPIFSSPWYEHPLYIEDGWLVFTANFDGQYAVYGMALKEREICRYTLDDYAISAVIDKETERLYYIGLNRDGNDIYMTRFSPCPYQIGAWPESPKPIFGKIEYNHRTPGFPLLLKTLSPAVHMPILMPTDMTFRSWNLGCLFAGGDATDENIYFGYLGYHPEKRTPVLKISYWSKFFSPLLCNCYFNYKNSIYYALEYPIYVSLGSGLSNLTLFVDGRSFYNFSRKEFSPGVFLRFDYPFTSIQAQFETPFERRAWGSVIDRQAMKFKIGLFQNINEDQISLINTNYFDSDNPDSVRFSLYGYPEITTVCAQIIQVGYSHRFLKLRKGLWNPNLYFEDIFGKIFFETARDAEGNCYYSAGTILQVEMKMGFGYLQFTPGLGFAVTKEGKFKLFLGVESKQYNNLVLYYQ